MTPFTKHQCKTTTAMLYGNTDLPHFSKEGRVRFYFGQLQLI